MSVPSYSVVILGYVGTFAFHLIDRHRLLLAFFAYVVIDSSIIHPHKEPILDYVIVYGILIYLCVNFIYLVRRPRK